VYYEYSVYAKTPRLNIAPIHVKKTGWPKTQAANFCPYLCQILTDFQIFFSGIFCGKMCNKVVISQGSGTTLLRCVGIFSNWFITNFPQNVPVKKVLEIGQYLAKLWTKVCSFLFGPPRTPLRPDAVFQTRRIHTAVHPKKFLSVQSVSQFIWSHSNSYMIKYKHK